MFIADVQGVISSVVYGPDLRTRIRPDTQDAFFTVYAPSGIKPNTVIQHLNDIYKYILIFSPNAQVGLLETFYADKFI